MLKDAARDDNGRCADFFCRLFDQYEAYPDEDAEELFVMPTR